MNGTTLMNCSWQHSWKISVVLYWLKFSEFSLIFTGLKGGVRSFHYAQKKVGHKGLKMLLIKSALYELKSHNFPHPESERRVKVDENVRMTRTLVDHLGSRRVHARGRGGGAWACSTRRPLAESVSWARVLRRRRWRLACPAPSGAAPSPAAPSAAAPESRSWTLGRVKCRQRCDAMPLLPRNEFVLVALGRFHFEDMYNNGVLTAVKTTPTFAGTKRCKRSGVSVSPNWKKSNWPAYYFGGSSRSTHNSFCSLQVFGVKFSLRDIERVFHFKIRNFKLWKMPK